MAGVILRDVMNSKSDRHFRHSENAYDIKKLSLYYAIESRLFNGVWDEELSKYKRGPLWFTNLMVFDFDFDEDHFPNVKDYEKKLHDSLSKLETILGKPKYKIFNKTEFTDYQKEVYFTKNGVVKLPKKSGCQVVYELKESLQSQYKERIKLYNQLRLHISGLVDADLNFKGHMFKNIYNKQLFNIEENKNCDLIDIFEIAKKLHFSNVDQIQALKPFESLERINVLPSYLKEYNTKLLSFYQDLNSWKSKDYKVNYRNKMFYMENCTKKESRNETLFEYFKSIPLSQLESITYYEVINSNLFDLCVIKDIIDENEFETTRQSVLNYRKENNIEFIDNNVDNRVFKINQQAFSINYYKDNEEKFKEHYNSININKTISSKWMDKNIDIELYDNTSNSNILANIFLKFGAEEILSNIRNLFIPDMLDFYKNIFKNDSCYIDFGLYDLYCILKDAIYLTHFKYYNSIQQHRKSKNVNKVNTVISKREKRQQLIKNWGIDFSGNILKFEKFYNKLKKNNLLKENGTPLAISFYQNYFHIRNIFASAFVKIINKFLKVKQIIQKLIDIKHIYKITFKNTLLNLVYHAKNNSQILNNLINSFNIYDKLFIIKDKLLINVKYYYSYIIRYKNHNKTTINNTDIYLYNRVYYNNLVENIFKYLIDNYKTKILLIQNYILYCNNKCIIYELYNILYLDIIHILL